MTLTQFIAKYRGKRVDADGAYGAQCVDLLKKYYPEVLGVPAIRGNGVDYFANSPATKFLKFYNTPTRVPRAGDVMVWKKTAYLPYGHVGIVTRANVFWFETFEQNWPGGSACRINRHSYIGKYPVLGWVRKK